MWRQRRALVVGLGVAGLSATIGLRQAGWSAVVVERAPERRTGGYFVGLFPEGKKAAERLGIAEHLHTRNPLEGGDYAIDRHGRRSPTIGFLEQPGEPLAVMRGDIEAALWQRVHDVTRGTSEVRFNTRPVAITQTPGAARALLHDELDGSERWEDFDLVVGADGLRSSVRQLVFGPHEDFMQSWNSIICAFELAEQVPGFGPQDSIVSARSRRAAWVFGFADRTPTALLTYRTPDVDAQFRQDPDATLRAAYRGMEDDPVVRHLLDSSATAPHRLFDSVHQIHMPRWSSGRVVLVGDAAWCLNLYSGMGASSAMRGGAALGEALASHPDDLPRALAAYEAALRPYVTSMSRRARVVQQLFVPSGPIAEVVRAGVLRTLTTVQRRQGTRAETRLQNPLDPRLDEACASGGPVAADRPRAGRREDERSLSTR